MADDPYAMALQSVSGGGNAAPIAAEESIPRKLLRKGKNVLAAVDESSRNAYENVVLPVAEGVTGTVVGVGNALVQAGMGAGGYAANILATKSPEKAYIAGSQAMDEAPQLDYKPTTEGGRILGETAGKVLGYPFEVTQKIFKAGAAQHNKMLAEGRNPYPNAKPIPEYVTNPIAGVAGFASYPILGKGVKQVKNALARPGESVPYTGFDEHLADTAKDTRARNKGTRKAKAKPEAKAEEPIVTPAPEVDPYANALGATEAPVETAAPTSDVRVSSKGKPFKSKVWAEKVLKSKESNPENFEAVEHEGGWGYREKKIVEEPMASTEVYAEEPKVEEVVETVAEPEIVPERSKIEPLSEKVEKPVELIQESSMADPASWDVGAAVDFGGGIKGTVVSKGNDHLVVEGADKIYRVSATNNIPVVKVEEPIVSPEVPPKPTEVAPSKEGQKLTDLTEEPVAKPETSKIDVVAEKKILTPEEIDANARREVARMREEHRRKKAAGEVVEDLGELEGKSIEEELNKREPTPEELKRRDELIKESDDYVKEVEKEVEAEVVKAPKEKLPSEMSDAELLADADRLAEVDKSLARLRVIEERARQYRRAQMEKLQKAASKKPEPLVDASQFDLSTRAGLDAYRKAKAEATKKAETDIYKEAKGEAAEIDWEKQLKDEGLGELDFGDEVGRAYILEDFSRVVAKALHDVGVAVWNAGKRTFEGWSKALEKYLGLESWGKIKNGVDALWKSLQKYAKDEKGSIQIPESIRSLKERFVQKEYRPEDWDTEFNSAARKVWDKVEEKYPAAKNFMTGWKELGQGMKEAFLDQEHNLRNDPPSKELLGKLLKGEDRLNGFIEEHLLPLYELPGKIGKGSAESKRVGAALDGKLPVSELTKAEKSTYDFMKDKYDFMIQFAARHMAGSEEAYRRILSLVNSESPSLGRVKDMSAADKIKYDALRKELNTIKAGKKKSELSPEQLDQYEKVRIAMNNLRLAEKALPKEQRMAFDLLKRKVKDYLPHLFDKEDLKVMFDKELAEQQVKLNSSNAKVRRMAQKRIDKITEALSNLRGGKLITYEQLPKNLRFGAFEKRDGKEGYSFDAVKAYEFYVYGLGRKLFVESALKDAAKLYKSVDPKLKPYVSWMVKHFMGFDKSWFDKAASSITTFEWIRAMGLNPRSAIQNLTQRVNTVVSVGEKYAAKAEKMMWTDREKVNELYKKSGIPREIPNVITEAAPSEGLKRVRAVSGVLFNFIENGNRKHAFLSGYLKAKDLGMSEADAIQYGIDLTHKTQFRYGKLGTPKALANPVGRVAFQFGSFTIKQSQFLYDLFKEDKVAFMKYIAYSTGLTYTVKEFFDMDLTNALGFGITMGEALKAVKFAADGDLIGAQRHLKQAVTEEGGLFQVGLGPAAKGALNVIDKMSEGKGMEQLKKELTPAMYRRLKQAYDAVQNRDGNEYPIYDESKHLKYFLTPEQLIKRTIGPGLETERKENVQYLEEKNLEQERQQITKKIIDLRLSEDPKDQDKADALEDKYGVFPTAKQISEELKAREVPAKERKKTSGKAVEYQEEREGSAVGEDAE